MKEKLLQNKNKSIRITSTKNVAIDVGGIGHRAGTCGGSDKRRRCFNCRSERHLRKDCPTEAKCSHCNAHRHALGGRGCRTGARK